MDDAAQRGSIATAGHRRVADRYSFDAMVSRVQDIYVDVLASERSRLPAGIEVEPAAMLETGQEAA